jgi:glycerate kinase
LIILNNESVYIGVEKMKALIAPDSFKGCLSAASVAQAMAKGLKKGDEHVWCTLKPVGDGGEGTVESLVQATGGQFSGPVDVHDPLGRPVKAHYGISGNGEVAMVELAEASGLSLLKKEELEPANTSTIGTGELLLQALDDGFRQFIICLGGSATNDAGAGLLQALGYRFLDALGEPLNFGGQALSQLVTIDVSGADPRLKDCQFTIASDVTNPLVGENGASAVFGPQKGADPVMVAELDRALTRFADVVEKTTGKAYHKTAGGGAAGGCAAGILAFLPAILKSGIETVLETAKFKAFVKNNKVDVILTGEGKIDGQTSQGKVIAGLAAFGKKHGIPVIALTGELEGDLHDLYALGLTAAWSIAPGPVTAEESMEKAAYFIESQSETLGRLLKQLKG